MTALQLLYKAAGQQKMINKAKCKFFGDSEINVIKFSLGPWDLHLFHDKIHIKPPLRPNRHFHPSCYASSASRRLKLLYEITFLGIFACKAGSLLY